MNYGMTGMAVVLSAAKSDRLVNKLAFVSICPGAQTMFALVNACIGSKVFLTPLTERFLELTLNLIE